MNIFIYKDLFIVYVIMTEFVLDIETRQQSDDHSSHGCPSYTKYFFQIDINGNVNISEKISCKSDGAGEKKYILSIYIFSLPVGSN